MSPSVGSARTLTGFYECPRGQPFHLLSPSVWALRTFTGFYEYPRGNLFISVFISVGSHLFIARLSRTSALKLFLFSPRLQSDNTFVILVRSVAIEKNNNKLTFLLTSNNTSVSYIAVVLNLCFH